MGRLALFTALSASLLLPSTAVAADLFVAPGGAGGSFASISMAVSVAAPGDHIYVAPGTYVETVSIAKPLAIFAEPGAVLQHPNVLQLSPSTLEVRNIPAGEEVVVSGLKIVGSTGSLLSFVEIRTIEVHDNQGSVVLHNLEVESRRFAALDVVNSDRVLLLDSNLYPNLGAVNECCLDPLVQVSGSTLFVTNSVLVGLPVPPPGGSPLPSNTPALFASGARVVLHGSDLTGGAGGSVLGVASPGAPGVQAFNSEVELRNAVVRGGAGGFVPPNPFLPQGSVGAGGPALSLGLASVSEADLSTSALGGLSGDGLTVAPPVSTSGGSTAQLIPVHFPRLLVTLPAGAGSIGQPAALALEGLPNDRHFLFLASASGPESTLPGIAGEFLLDSQNLTYLGRIPLNAQGNGQWTATVPADPALVGLTAFFQTLSPTGVSPAFGNLVLIPITG